jgi:hypothetical protein
MKYLRFVGKIPTFVDKTSKEVLPDASLFYQNNPTMIEVIAIKVDAEVNIEYKLYFNAAGKPCIRVFDLDVNDAVSITIYPTLERATAEFENATKSI